MSCRPWIKPYQFFFSHSTYRVCVFHNSQYFISFASGGEGTTHAMVVDIIIIKFVRVFFVISQYPVRARERKRPIRSKV